MAAQPIGPRPLSPSGIGPLWPAAALDATAAALVGVDLEGRTVFWSPGAERLFGWTASQVLGRVPPIIPLPLASEWQVQIQRVLRTGQATQPAETQRVARDGRLLTVVRSASPLRDAERHVTGVLDTLTDVTALKHLDEESRALSQVRERELIAMDLHDGLIQSLYAMVLTLDARQRALPVADVAARASLTQTLVDLQRVIDETRSYLFDLHAREFAPRDLASGLRLLADGLRLNAPIQVDLKLDPSSEQAIEPAVRGHLLFLAREAVSNVLRHARASTVLIELSRDDDAVRLAIVDNGRGFSAARRKRVAHHGLRNMAERARLIGGRYAIESSRGRGTRVSVELEL